MKKILLLPIFILFSVQIGAQNFYRISGDYTIKGKSETSAQLVIGKFYYDKNEKKIIHSNSFPEKAIWVTSDTNLFKVVNNKIEFRQTIPNFTQFSMYHLVLNNQLNNFGLDGTIFTLDKVEEQNGLVITTWIPPKHMKKIVGRILISSKDDNLYGVIFFDAEDKIIKKQFFEDYSVTSGLAFPGQITEITYAPENREIYQVTTYRNILVNSHHEEQLYHFNISDFQ